jgi:hypothetical protein
MRKIRLELDTLQVDTFFATPEPRDTSGTVLAHSGEQWSECLYATCMNTDRCGPLTLEPVSWVNCSGGCEHEPGWTQDCPEVVESTLIDPGC